MHLRYLLVCFFVLAALSQVTAQEIGYGFRAGLSYAKFIGDSEIADDGSELESFSFASGFHIGFTLNYKVTDLFGVRGEIMFTQKGTEYNYEGESWFILGRGTTPTTRILGVRMQELNISTASIEIPISAYHRLGPLEFSLGVSPSLLLGASAGGSINFEGRSNATGNPIDPFAVNLTYNYVKDEEGTASNATNTVRVDGQNYQVPQSIGAYYFFDEKDKNALELIDIGLIGGLSFYLNESLFLGVRVTRGLLDVDRNEYDYSLKEIGAGQVLIPRSDKNTSLAYQISIGFSF